MSEFVDGSELDALDPQGHVALIRCQVVDNLGALSDVDIVVNRGLIERLGPSPLPDLDGLPRVDASLHVVVPGLANSHTHSHNILFRGVLDRHSVEGLIAMLDAANSGRTPQESYEAAIANAVECLRGGATSVCDMVTFNLASSEHLAAVMQAYDDVGVRAVVAPQIVDRSFFDGVPHLRASIQAAGLGEALASEQPSQSIDTYARLLTSASVPSTGLVSLGVAPGVPHQCSDPLLNGAVELAASLGAGIFTHLAESRLETYASQRRFGGRFLNNLAERGILGPRTLAAHSVWLSKLDMALLAEAGSVVAHCPGSNLRLGAGVARVKELRRAGVRVVLGSDGAASSDNLSAFGSIRDAGNVSRLLDPSQSEWLGAGELIAMATDHFAVSPLTEGARTLQPGAPADLLFLSTRSTYLNPHVNILNQLAFADAAPAIDHVMVAGRFVLGNSRVITVDEQLHAEALHDQSRIAFKRNADKWDLAREFMPLVDAAVNSAQSLDWRSDGDPGPDWLASEMIPR